MTYCLATQPALSLSLSLARAGKRPSDFLQAQAGGAPQEGAAEETGRPDGSRVEDGSLVLFLQHDLKKDELCLFRASIFLQYSVSTVDHLIEVLDRMRPPAPGRRSRLVFLPALRSLAYHVLCAGLVPVNDLGIQAQEY